MKDGFIKVAAASPKIKVADTPYNSENIINMIDRAYSLGAKAVTFPELCITGYTCGDLFLSTTLISGAEAALGKIIAATEGREILVCVGLPVRHNGKLYNCAAVIFDGRLLGIVPKTAIPNHGDMCEARYFESAPRSLEWVDILGDTVAFGSNILFRCSEIGELSIAVEIGEDLWLPTPVSNAHAAAGATVILNPAATDETVGKSEYRCRLVKEQSARLICGYVYSDAGEGESTTDAVYSGHLMVSENGEVLAEQKPFEDSGLIISEIDVSVLAAERVKMTTYPAADSSKYEEIYFDLTVTDTVLTRKVDRSPFIPTIESERAERCEAILDIQAHGLKKRLEHISAKCAVVAVSGGLDSTLAILVTCRAMDLLGRPHSDVIAVSMPGFGTTKRTKGNAEILCEQLGVSYREVPITDAVKIHFRDIEHDENVQDVTYENSQARERTQIAMDIANKNGGILIGTGDLSELALGWATYNGDHMSMYGVNGGVPKTLIRHIVAYCASKSNDKLADVLNDILATPVSPELLPAKDGEISQKTEDIVGPYELHDFFIYHFLRYGTSPTKLFRLACTAFDGIYDKATIFKWQKNFTRRFFMQQFKRSCLPDGPKVGSVGLSPRGDFRMPSDALATLWMNELETVDWQK